MNALLAPAYTLTLGSQEWREQLLGLELELAAGPGVDLLTLRLPAQAPLSAALGDPVQLVLASGEKEATVFTGTVEAIGRRADEIAVRALDAAGVMARLRPAATYEKVTAGTVIRNLAGEAGAEVGEVAEGVELAFYVADPSRTALEHAARVAGWSGALLGVSAEGRLEARVIDASQAEVALRWGRELLGFARRERTAPVESFVVAGEAGAGSTESPEALRPVADFFGGSRPDGPSLAHRFEFQPALRTTQAAATAGAARSRDFRAKADRGWFEAYLQPELRPGTVVEIQDAPEGLLAGPVWLSRVRHRFGPRGALTRAWFARGGDRFDPLALLGALASLF
ncbi:MAG: hypothetical protein U0002_18580 [Thermoanaerobaculia bacterium]